MPFWKNRTLFINTCTYRASEASEEKNESQRHPNWHFFTKFHDISSLFKFHDFSMHGFFLAIFHVFQCPWEPCIFQAVRHKIVMFPPLQFCSYVSHPRFLVYLWFFYFTVVIEVWVIQGVALWLQVIFPFPWTSWTWLFSEIIMKFEMWQTAWLVMNQKMVYALLSFISIIGEVSIRLW